MVPRAEYIHFVLTVLGGFCSFMFALVGWGIRMVVSRAMHRLEALEKEIRRNRDFRLWAEGRFSDLGVPYRPES